MDDQNKNEITQRMDRVNEILDEYESSVGLPKYNETFSGAVDAGKYLNMSRDQIEKLTVEDCAEAALVLGGLSFHVQRSINRENSRLNWAKSLIKEIICRKSHQYSGAWSNQDMQATLDNDVSQKLHSIQKYCQQRIDRLTYMSNSIKGMSDLFINLQRARIASNG